MDRSEPMVWRPLEPFGAEIDHDLSSPLCPEARAQLRRLVHERRLVVARGQSLTLDQQQNLMEAIGPVLRGARGMAEVSPKDGVLNNAPLAWHSDLAFAPEPFTALSLHAVDVLAGQTNTRFADATLAARALPPALRRRAEAHQAVFVQPLGPDTRQIDAGGKSGAARRTWPILIPHPVTGEELLWVNESHVDHVVGLAPTDSHRLLADLFDHLYAAAHTLAHPWRNGDLLIWDNYALQHGRADLEGVTRRRLQRASVARRSMMEQLPQFFDSRVGASAPPAEPTPSAN